MSDEPVDRPFIPREKRASQNVGFGDYAKKLIVAGAVTKGSAVAGTVVGDVLAGPSGAAMGYMLAGLGAAAYEGHQHWKPIKGTQERVEAILPEVQAELNPDNIKEEIALQQQIKDGLAERQKLFTDMVKKREAGSIEPRGKAVDALAKEAKAAETDWPSRT